MKFRSTLARVWCLLIAASCTHQSSTKSVPTADVQGAMIVDAQLKGSIPTPYISSPVSGTVQAPIDEAGRLVLRQMRVTPVVPENARRDIEAWLAGFAFEPALHGGKAVRSMFSIVLEKSKVRSGSLRITRL